MYAACRQYWVQEIWLKDDIGDDFQLFHHAFVSIIWLQWFIIFDLIYSARLSDTFIVKRITIYYNNQGSKN